MENLEFTFQKVLKLSQWFGIEAFPHDSVLLEEELLFEQPEILPNNERWRNLTKEISKCQLCSLSQQRNCVVIGSGDVNSDLMVVGEGPGAEEDRQGLPFVGKGGELLTKMLKGIQIDREKVYITNIVKCRPPKNRDPNPEEISACRDYLLLQISLVQPKAILAVGAYASRTLLAKPGVSLSSLRGKRWHFENIPLVVTYHPAALLRNSSYKKPTWEDLKFLRKIIDELS